MDDALHLEKFNHSLSMDLPVNASVADKVKPQKLDYFLVLDLEGKVEILEFPVVMIDAHSMEFIDSFHRYNLFINHGLLVIWFNLHAYLNDYQTLCTIDEIANNVKLDLLS